MPWRPAAFSDLEREKHQLQMAVLKLRRELETKQQYAGRLEVLLHQRSERIDELTGVIDSLRLKNRLLGQENGHLAAMLSPK
jgi:chromosome segregation ATPase